MFASAPNRVTIIIGDAAAFLSAPSIVRVDCVEKVHEAAATEDVERIILDRSTSAEEFLHLLTVLPPLIAGDVMFIRGDGSGFLSATARGGDRVLYELRPKDVAFYLETTGLTRRIA